MFEHIKEFFQNLIKSRIFVFAIVIIILAILLIQRIFSLQIINGEYYQENYNLKIEKTKTIYGTRGLIYDRNGEVLAYNKLAYSVTIEDSGEYDSTEEKNASLNAEIYELLQELDENGDEITNSFGISLNDDGKFEFNVEGSSLSRFKADVFGHSSTDDLEYNSEIGGEESQATANQIIRYLASEDHFDLNEEDYEDRNNFYRILVIRYELSQYSYSKYITATVAEDVSEETVAFVKENADSLTGIEISEDTIRKYVDSEYFSHIIGYTGKISTEEYEELSAEDDSYTQNDIVGKAGIEQIMEEELQGTKGSQTLYVNNTGKVLETGETTEASAGNNVYLSIDKELTEVTYNLIEQELAGILYNKIVNVKSYNTSSVDSSDIQIPIYDVYFALIDNNVLDLSTFGDDDSTKNEKKIYNTFKKKQKSVLKSMKKVLLSDDTDFEDLSEEKQDYLTYIISLLKSDGILMTDEIDTTDETYLKWADGSISVYEYLNYAIEKSWVNTADFEVDEKYSDSEELYNAMVEYIISEIETDSEFAKEIYYYLVQDDAVTGTQLCMALFDQGVLKDSGDERSNLASGATSAYSFLKEKIKDIELTPAQIGLDPCSASCVITDTQTGELLACVSYPGYDNNQFTGSVDATYYASLSSDNSLPLYNHATQEQTAPGSTFKMVTAAAGLTEGVITTSETIKTKGVYEKVSPNPKCWIYPSTHGSINVSEAIRDSCNYFFYEVGYRLSLNNGDYDADQGISTIQKYASLFGLDSTTGIEISESEPSIADEYPVTAAIGQSNNSYTTIQLARYVTAVANSGTVYNYTLLSKVTDSDGNVLEEYSPEVKNEITEISDSTWDAIHSGMRMVVEEHEQFDDLEVKVAGKTGTAQQDTSRANHALFVGYAPYNNPEMSIATRISYGYSSSNAADLSAKVISYYFGETSAEDILTNSAETISDNSNSFGD
ncbi:penicillin-binding transpeptidase domain-containing protein [Eubacterium oxidoreducens]|uniref:Penicillin-binding protein 2 n=1 Tax=Eubacterium oxidoreducens TaxID=1732 RepID=A0A1G6AM62_EUBOX|nr:penicillin-binding transpeptidase domain-containing protein [Eubacterium oxidoreducens]SDB09233.1 penicillin-binding protein 2 [Eubacterium oxidoreducens]